MPPSMSARFQDLADPALRRGLEQMVRARVPSSEVDDLVQATLTDALASSSIPSEAEEVRKWVFGIARHKIVDFYRRSKREQPGSVPELAAPGAAHGAKDMLAWAEKELAEHAQGDETLEWMLREGDGEKLETIADDERVPAPRVRQRVSRWRKHLRERWAAELAAVAALAVVIGALWWAWRNRDDHAVVEVGPDHSAVPPVDSTPIRAAELRERALQQCEKQQWQACLQGLDEAAKLDPEGDRSEPVVRARQGAADALRPAPSPSPSSMPSTQAPPVPKPVQTDAPPRPKAPMKSDSDIKKMAPPQQPAPSPTLNNKNEEFNVAPVDNSPPAPTTTAPPAPQQQQQQYSPPEQKDPPMQTFPGKKKQSSYNPKQSAPYSWGSSK